MKPIVPAIIPKSAGELRETLGQLKFSPEIHVDVVDGKFVPFVSWPYEPTGSPAEVKQSTDSYTLEVDLMVEDPLPVAKEWIKAGADMLVFHVETISYDEFVDFVSTTSISIGISALNDTPLAVFKPYIKVADAIQLMGIAKIGAQGLPLDERVFDRIEELKREFPHHPITIDGSVNVTTIKKLNEAGVDRFICGSAIVGAESPLLAYQKLRQEID